MFKAFSFKIGGTGEKPHLPSQASAARNKVKIMMVMMNKNDLKIWYFRDFFVTLQCIKLG